MAFRTECHNDLTKFGNRLWTLMQRDGYDTPKKLAEALLDAKLVAVRSRSKEGDTADSVRKRAVSSVEKRIAEHIKSDTITDVQGRYIAAYCEHFSCSADYLLGRTLVKDADPKVQMAVKLTGLSEDVILRLSKARASAEEPSFVHWCWNQLLESDLFNTLPYDWGAAHREAVEYVGCKAAIDALTSVLDGEDADSTECAVLSIKEKVLEKSLHGHYAAYYGLLHKLAQDAVVELDALIEKRVTKDREYEKAFGQLTRQYENELRVAKGDPVPPVNNEDFRFNRHFIA